MSYDIHEDKKENHTIVEQGETGSTQYRSKVFC